MKNTKNKNTPEAEHCEASAAGQPLLGDVNGGSILIDRLIHETENTTCGINGVWYRAKIINYTFTLKRRIIGAWMVLTGFSFAVHFASDEANKNRH